MEKDSGGIAEMSRRLRSFLIPVSLILAGAVLIGIGLWHGQAEAVFRKAIRICLECIGIG